MGFGNGMAIGWPNATYQQSGPIPLTAYITSNNDLILQGPNFVRTLRNEMFRGDYKIISPCVLQVNNQCK